MMRLSMARTPETREATFSALARKFPLLDAAVSVILPLATDTVTPAGASPMLISSLMAETWATGRWRSHEATARWGLQASRERATQLPREGDTSPARSGAFAGHAMLAAPRHLTLKGGVSPRLLTGTL
jgi:hypothetical protein